MKRMTSFAVRTQKEILRDPLNLIFGLGFPVVLLLLMSLIQKNIPVPLFEIQTLAPAITVFGLSFFTLFTATLVSRDRETAFLQRLCTTPLTSADFILGYALPVVPIAAGQTVLCYLFALLFGLSFSVNWLWGLLINIPCTLLYIAIGIFCGSLMNVKQVGGICGALLTNLTAWLSGAWFDISLIGGVFARIARALPFFHAVEAQRAAMAGDLSTALPHTAWVLAYAAGFAVLSAYAFLHRRKSI